VRAGLEREPLHAAWDGLRPRSDVDPNNRAALVTILAGQPDWQVRPTPEMVARVRAKHSLRYDHTESMKWPASNV